MVSKRRSQEATATPPKKTKAELAATEEEEENQAVEEKQPEEQEGEGEGEGEKEEMEVIDEAKDDEEKTAEEEKPKEKEYIMEMPGNVEGITEEAVEKTIKSLKRGKIAVLKYVEAVKRAYDITAAMYPDQTRDPAQEASLTVLTDFKEEVNKGLMVNKMSDENKKAFAYHVEVCKSAVPKLFEEAAVVAEMKDEPAETEVQKLFKKAPTFSIATINTLISRGAKVVKEKKSLLKELNDLNMKMQIVDNLLCLQLVEANTDEKKAWQFFQENTDQIIELFPSLEQTELVILDFCKDIGNRVLEKMSICRKNWTSLGSQLTSKSPSVSSLVDGPLVTADLLAANKSTVPFTAETRSTLLNVLGGILKKVNNDSAGIVKNLMSKEDLESYNYIVNDLVVLIGKQTNKALLPEEKLYIAYHLNKVRPYVTKIGDLNTAKTVLEGNYTYHDRPEVGDKKTEGRKSFGSPRGSFRGKGEATRGSSFNKRGGGGFNRSSGGGSGYRGGSSGFRGSGSGFRGSGSGFRGSGSGFQKSFNHYGAY